MRNKKLTKAMAMALAAVTMAGVTFSPIYAVVNEEQTITTNQTATTQVNYSQTSNFSVKVPKTVTLDSNKQATYTVDVNGDIASNEKITVAPSETVTMKDANSIKADVTGTISQNKTTWKYNEMDTDAAGTITATDLTAGTWSGSFNFDIKLEEEKVVTTKQAHLWDTSFDGTIIFEEDMTWGDWIESDYAPSGIYSSRNSFVMFYDAYFGGTYYITLNGAQVELTDKIVEGAEYWPMG